MAGIDDHDAAVDRELVPQVWSLGQPAFKERVAALQAKITPKRAALGRRSARAQSIHARRSSSRRRSHSSAVMA